MRTTYITAIVIALVLALWLWSGQGNSDDTNGMASLADQNREQARVQEDAAPTRVRVVVSEAAERQRIIKVRGKTVNKRTVAVKAELSGKIVNRPVERGMQVVKNDILCEISLEDRQVSLVEAQASVSQSRIEYQGALRLKQKGFNSQTAIAGAKARLATAHANLARRQLDLQKLQVRAPFAGVVEDVHQEIGDYVTPGSSCATIVDMDPILLVGRVSERDVVALSLTQTASGVLSNGDRVSGPLTFIGQTSDPATRTYPIEIQLPNPNYTLRSGITTEIDIPVENVMAQRVSPALFALDDEGAIGVRIIDANNVVEFHNIEILADAEEGVWVSGLPNLARIIVVGQELVTAGERVDPVFENKIAKPALPKSGPAAETLDAGAQMSSSSVSKVAAIPPGSLTP